VRSGSAPLQERTDAAQGDAAAETGARGVPPQPRALIVGGLALRLQSWAKLGSSIPTARYRPFRRSGLAGPAASPRGVPT
jgi:hypothetical protein